MADGDIDLSNPFYQALISRGQSGGWSPMHIASAIGRAQVENGGQTGGTPGDDGTAFGGFQWRGDRYNQLQNVAQQMGTNWQDPKAQAEHYWSELENGGEKANGAALKNARTMDEAGNAVISGERPAGWSANNPSGGAGYGKQLNYAQQAFAQLNGNPMTQAMANPADQPAPGSSPMSGQQSPSMQQFMQQQNSDSGSMFDKFKDGGPGALFGLPSQRPWDLGSALQGIGTAGMAINNPAGANAMAQVPAMEARSMIPKFAVQNYQPETGRAIGVNQRTGAAGQIQIGSPFQKMPETEWKAFGDRNNDVNQLNYTYKALDNVRQQLASGDLNLSGLARVQGMINNKLNISDPNDQKIANYIHQIGLVHSSDMSMQKGVQTDADSENLHKALLPEGSDTDNAQVLQSLDNVLNKRRVALNSAIQLQQGTAGKYGPSNGNQLPGGPWSDPNHYSDMQQAWDKNEADFAPKREAFLAQRAAQQAQATGASSQPAAPRYSGSTSQSGGSLPTATGPNGAKLILKDGAWVPLK